MARAMAPINTREHGKKFMVGSDWQCRFSHVWVLAEAEGRLEAASADCQEIDRTIDRVGGARPFDYFWLATWEGAAILHSMPDLISLLEVGATPRGGGVRGSLDKGPAPFPWRNQLIRLAGLGGSGCGFPIGTVGYSLACSWAWSVAAARRSPLRIHRISHSGERP